MSPALKSGRNEKDAKTVETSPSAKATLDSYLRTSPDSHNVAKASCKIGDSLARQDQVRRNLASEMDNSSRNEPMQLRLSSQLHTRASEASGANQKEISEGVVKVDDVAAGGSSKDQLDIAGGVENVEMKKFAADFLSLYCRYCNVLFFFLLFYKIISAFSLSLSHFFLLFFLIYVVYLQ